MKKDTGAVWMCCSHTHVGDSANLAGSLQIVSVTVCLVSFSHGDSSLPRCDDLGYNCNNGCSCRYLSMYFQTDSQILFDLCCFFRVGDISFADIDIVCLKNSVAVTWNITAELVPYAGRLFLGNCVASKLKVLPAGDGVVQFNYPLTGCKFVKEVTKMLNVTPSSIISISFTYFSADEGKIHLFKK